jgi:hypothetical protein
VRATRTPVLLLPPTGNDGSELYPHGLQVSLTRAGIPSCYVDFPAHTTGDLQISVQYLVYAIRTVYGRAGREIAVYGLSLGALLPRFALLYWPSLRRMVSDAVLVSGDQYGTLSFSALIAAVCSRPGCPIPRLRLAAGSRGSNLLRAINRQGRDPTPGPTAWTTVHSLTDEIALPASGPHPTAVLPGASDLVIQKICPGRQTYHIATAFDSVSYAALIDAITHPGPARSARISRSVCGHLYAPGLDPRRTSARIAQINAAADSRVYFGALFSREPAVRRWVRTR